MPVSTGQAGQTVRCECGEAMVPRTNGGYQMYYCNGRNYDVGVVPGRIGSGNLNAPYTNPGGYNTYCDKMCSPADHPNELSGYKACNGFNAVVTVWR